MESLGFRVTGAFLTEHARERLFDYGWQEAADFLRRTLQGCGYDTVIDILAGKSRLEGVNQVAIIPDSDSGPHLSRLALRFAGSVHDRKYRVWMRPYAEVTDHGIEDLRPFAVEGWRGRYNRYHLGYGPPQHLAGFGMDNVRWGLFRCVLYMDDRERDRAVLLHTEGQRAGYARAVLWRETEPPPIWYEQPADFQIGLNEYLAAGLRLEQRGAAWWRETAGPPEIVATLEAVHPFQKPPMLNLRRFDTTRAENPLQSDEPIERLPSWADPCPALEEATTAARTVEDVLAATKPGAEDLLPEPDRELNADHGWITRDGKFWGCRRVGHKLLAFQLFKLLEGREATDSDKEATAAGWVKIGSNLDSGEPFLHLEGQPTKAQTTTTVEWCLKHEVRPSTVLWLTEQ